MCKDLNEILLQTDLLDQVELTGMLLVSRKNFRTKRQTMFGIMRCTYYLRVTREIARLNLWYSTQMQAALGLRRLRDYLYSVDERFTLWRVFVTSLLWHFDSNFSSPFY